MLLLAATLGAIMSTNLYAPEAPKRNVLVFSKTRGFRHDSIPDGRRAIYKIADERNWTVTFTEDSTWFEEKKLKAFDALVFLCTTGDVLEDEQQRALENYIHAGGGYVGIHAAADTEYEWPWYGKLVGGYFKIHPRIQEAVVKIEDSKHPATKHLPNPWKRTDEWYDYKENPRKGVHVLASMDQKSYEGSTMGDDHPIMWCQEFEGGRSFYTGFGHTKESYSDPLFTKLIGEAIEWVSEAKKKH